MLQNLFRSYFARFMYPLAQAFVLNKILRGVIFCTPFWLYDIWLTWKARSNFFFWDTIQLGSKHAHFFYETHFSSLLLPDNIDSGHPPFFGMYLAFVWKIFDKTLIFSHLSMLPLLLGITWQALKLGEKALGEWQAVLFILILKINPIMAGQSVMMSPDVVLVFFFLLAFNAVLNNNKKILTIAILGLSMISMRGMMTAAILFIYELIKTFQVSKIYKSSNNLTILSIFKLFSKTILPYLLGGFCALSFLIYHYLAKGWIGYHAGSEWAEAFQVVDFQGFIKNMIVYIWRLVDAGHLFLMPIILYGFYKIKTDSAFKNTHTLFILLFIALIVLTPTLIIYKGLLQHRYLLPIYLIMNLLCLKIISDLKIGKLQNGLYILVFVGLLSGHFWVYPQPIATSWDTTLAQLPYYRLRNDMIQYIDNQQFKYEDIGTAYPNLASFKFIDLKEPIENQTSFSPINFNKNKYIFYSNVMNDFNKKELDELSQNWKPLKILRGGQVEVILYERK